MLCYMTGQAPPSRRGGRGVRGVLPCPGIGAALSRGGVGSGERGLKGAGEGGKGGMGEEVRERRGSLGGWGRGGKYGGSRILKCGFN